MTKGQEELYKWFDEELSCNFNQLITRMNEFFSQNVCIPKGENRNIHADIFHQALEGVEIQFKYRDTAWVDIEPFDDTGEYRIKPPVAPTYCYKWRLGVMFGVNAVSEDFHTEEEMKDFPFIKLEETKTECMYPTTNPYIVNQK